MNCPVCENVRIREVKKENVMIDVCPAFVAVPAWCLDFNKSMKKC